ncbi:microtubule binding protein [Clavulina sp. PMI_390]|nr:microtubule binding protein [Clavulina sp. PMI_390]
MGESRTELIQWVNDLLQTNYTKIEQLGSGGAYCQIIDSCYGDVPMVRVKMAAKHEYEYLANYKILQNVFKSHKIDKPIPVDRLVKCKMQDNLEFTQWIKRFWDQNFASESYDPIARRKGAAVESATIAPVHRPVASAAATSSAARGVGAGRRTPSGARSGSSSGGYTYEFVSNLQNQLRESVAQMEGLEKERDFYFSKLRDIEILVQNQLEAWEPEAGEKEGEVVLKEIQKILYSTEDGFEAPTETFDEGAPVDEEETF